ncbi:hypothetical protein PM082_019074 [Marasmius tenuissimus]|nr:hypothetical protein PM082_019074 [Marasmius tenuissimus]
MSVRDSGIVIEEPVPIVFPTPEILLENPPTPPKDTPVKSPPKRLAEKSSIARVRDRAKTLSQAPPSTLVKLLLSEETTTKKTSHLLSQAVEQLSTASQRAADAEASRRTLQVQTLLERTKRDQEVAFAQEEAIRAKNELDFYKRKLQETQDEATRAQQGMQAIQKRQAEAERNAAQARAIARKYRGQNMKMMAKEQGKLEGFREGLRLGREVIGAKYALEYDVDGQDTGSAYIEEYFESTEGSPTTAHGTPRTQPRRRDDRRSSKKPSRKHEDRTRSLGGSEKHRPRQQDRGSNGSSTPRGEPTVIPPTPPSNAEPSPAQTPTPVPREPPTPTSETPQPTPLPLTPPSIRAQELTLSTPTTPVAPQPPSQYTHSPQSGSGPGTPRIPFPDPKTYPTSPVSSGRSQDSHPRYEPSPAEPEVIAIRNPAYPQSVHSEQRLSSHSLASPLHVSRRSHPVIYVYGQQTPSQNSIASPLVDDVSLHNQEYVPMPPPPPSVSSPGSQRSPEIQAPLPSSGLQDREADRRREAEVSTPSTMTGIVGLRTFPSYVPTASSSGGGADVGGRAPSVAGSASGSVSGAQPPVNHAGSVRSNGSGEQWHGGRGRRILSTIDEQSREGSPPRLTPMHTGTSVQSSQSQARVKEWRRSLSASDSSPSETKPSSPMHTGSTFYAHAPPPSVVSQSTLASSTFPVETDLRRRRSSSSKTASIHIEVEPPSRATSDGRRTPVPGSPRSFGFSAPPDSTPREGRFPSDPRPRPGYLSPNRSPMDLVPIQETGSGPNEPPVIPGQIPRPPIPSNRPSGPPATSVPMNGFRPGPQAPPHIYANGQFPSNFVPQASTPRSVPLARPAEPADSDEDSEDEDESTTSSRRDLMHSLYGGGKASDIPPGTVSGGTPQVSWKSPSQGGSYESWPPNPPPVGPSTMSPASASPNPLPRPPQQVSGSAPPSWGAPTPSNSPYVQRGPAGASTSARSAQPVPAPNSILKKPNDVAWGAQPKKVSTSAAGGTPRLGGPSFTPRTAGTPRLGAMSPSIFASLERTLPPEASPRSKRSSLHAGTTPLFTASPIPGAAGSNSGRSSRNGSEDDDDDRFDPQTQVNTLANSGGLPRTVRMGTKVQVGVAGGSPYRPPATMPLYK